MTIRMGESWQARNGHRRWISMPLHDALALSAAGYAIIAPFWVLWKLCELGVWLGVETGLFLVSGILVIAAVARREARLSVVTLARLRWGLFMVNLRGGR